jgi:hypothetical protein
MLAPNRRRRDSNLKRDIFAVVTFVATGFLFYLIQIHNPQESGSEAVTDVVEEAYVQESIVETPITLKERGSRDS